MRTSIRIAALVLGGALFIGCDKKDNTATAPPPTPPATPPAVRTPNVPDTTAATDAGKKLLDNGDAAGKNLLDKVGATTLPSTPALPK